MKNTFSVLAYEIKRLAMEDLSLIEGKRIYEKKDTENGKKLPDQEKRASKCMVKVYLLISYLSNQKGILKSNIREFLKFIDVDLRTIKKALKDLAFYGFIYCTQVSRDGHFSCLVRKYENKMEFKYFKLTKKAMMFIINSDSIFYIRAYIQHKCYFESEKRKLRGYRSSRKDDKTFLSAKEVYSMAKRNISNYKVCMISCISNKLKKKYLDASINAGLLFYSGNLLFPRIEDDVDILYEEEEEILGKEIIRLAKEGLYISDDSIIKRIINLSKQFSSTKIIDALKETMSKKGEDYLIENMQLLLMNE